MFKLKKINGWNTKLIVDPKKSDYVNFSLYVGVGQKDDLQYDQTAHLLEHMIVKKNLKIFNEAIDFNAKTGYDYTQFYFKSKKEEFISHFYCFINNLIDFTIEDGSLKVEKNIVDVEMNSIRNANKMNEVEDELDFAENNNFIIPFKKDYPILLSTKNISKEILLDFFNKHYIADNMIFSLQTDDEKIVKCVENVLSKKLEKLKFEQKSLNSNVSDFEQKSFYAPLQNYYIIQTKEEDSKVTLNIPSVSKKHRLYTASLLYSEYLAGDPLYSVLLKELRGKRGLVYYTISNIIRKNNLCFLEIYYNTFSNNIRQVNRLIRKVIDDIGKNGITKKEFEKLKKNYIKQSNYQLDSNSEIYLDDVCIKLLKSDKIKGIGLEKSDYIDWIKNTTLEEFNTYAKHISRIKNYFLIGNGKNMSRKDLESFKSLRQKDYKNDYYYENMLTQGEKREYIKTLQASGINNISKAERGLVVDKKYTIKSEEQEK